MMPKSRCATMTDPWTGRTAPPLAAVVVATSVWVAALAAPAVAQETASRASHAPILEAMVELESVSDAKCNSTASRFEDFLFGTPLSAAARDRKIRLQKQWILDLWNRASRTAGAAGCQSQEQRERCRKASCHSAPFQEQAQ